MKKIHEVSGNIFSVSAGVIVFSILAFAVLLIIIGTIFGVLGMSPMDIYIPDTFKKTAIVLFFSDAVIMVVSVMVNILTDPSEF